MKKTAGCLIYNDENKILLAKRVKEPFKNSWTIVGGKIENEETIEKGVLREVQEELSLDIENLQFITSGMINENCKGHLFKGKAVGIPKLKKDELSEAKFFSIEEIPTLDIGFNHKDLILTNWK